MPLLSFITLGNSVPLGSFFSCYLLHATQMTSVLNTHERIKVCGDFYFQYISDVDRQWN